MRSPQPLRLYLRSFRLRRAFDQDVQWLHQTFARLCSCSDRLPKPPKPKVLNPTTSNPATPNADHRALGTALDLFSTSTFSPGSPLFHPDGAHIFLKLQSFLRAQYSLFGFKEVITPTIYKRALWEQSGHWENYKDDMFEATGCGAESTSTAKGKQAELGEAEKYGLKPMNCPGHCLLFKSQNRSYRDLPIRYADFSPLHRNEISGALSGLTRVRRFHQDDGHVFCRPSQVGEEIEKTLQFVGMVYETFGLGPYKLVLSTRPHEQFMGEIDEWDRAETQLKEALNNSGREWETNDGDGAFYGPKIDIILKDSDGKEHQTATVQLDFQLPQRFGLAYQAPAPELESKGLSTSSSTLLARSGDVTPVIIHRAILGSLERFMALLIEHYKGHWPFWLSPRQAIIVTIGKDPETKAYARELASALSGLPAKTLQVTPRPLLGRCFNVDSDLSGRSLSKKIVEAKGRRYNLICVVGPEETRQRSMKVDASGQPSTGILQEWVEARSEVWNPKALVVGQRDLTEIMGKLSDRYQ